MKEQDFNDLPNFTFNEIIRHYQSKGFEYADCVKEIAKLKKRLFIRLQKVRTQIGKPIKINCLTEGKHVKNSLHYMGMAIDWHVAGKVNMNKVLQACLDAGFSGIGVYPFWNKPGFHSDIRAGGIKLWKRDENGEYKGLV